MKLSILFMVCLDQVEFFIEEVDYIGKLKLLTGAKYLGQRGFDYHWSYLEEYGVANFSYLKFYFLNCPPQST